MNNTFFKIYCYVLLGLSVVFLVLAYVFDIHEIYLGITYHARFPAVLALGSFAALCFLSLVIAAAFTRKVGNTPMRFSWINLVLFLLYVGLVGVVVWHSAPGGEVMDYIKDSYSDIIVLGLSVIVAISFTSTISYIIRQTGNQPAEEAKASRNWYSVFMLLTLVMALVYLVIGVCLYDKGYMERDTIFAILITVVILLLSSSVIALMSVAGGKLMEKNKPMASIVNIFTAIVFLFSNAWCMTSVIPALEYLNVGYHSNPDLYLSQSTSTEAVDIHVVGEDDETVSEDIEDIEEEEVIYYDGDLTEVFYSEVYNPIWYRSESPEDSIYDVLRNMRETFNPSFLLLHINIKYIEENFEDIWYRDPKGKLFDKALIYISQHRDSLPLENIIRTYSPVIKAVITDSIYNENQYGQVVYWLNYAYDDIVNSTDGNAEYSQMFGQIYDIMSEDLSGDSERYEKYFDKIARIAHLEGASLEQFESLYYNDEGINKEAVVWAYSFWARRWKEGNLEKAKGVLNAIKDMFSEEEEYY